MTTAVSAFKDDYRSEVDAYRGFDDGMAVSFPGSFPYNIQLCVLKSRAHSRVLPEKIEVCVLNDRGRNYGGLV